MRPLARYNTVATHMFALAVLLSGGCSVRRPRPPEPAGCAPGPCSSMLRAGGFLRADLGRSLRLDGMSPSPRHSTRRGRSPSLNGRYLPATYVPLRAPPPLRGLAGTRPSLGGAGLVQLARPHDYKGPAGAWTGRRRLGSTALPPPRRG